MPNYSYAVQIILHHIAKSSVEIFGLRNTSVTSDTYLTGEKYWSHILSTSCITHLTSNDDRYFERLKHWMVLLITIFSPKENVLYFQMAELTLMCGILFSAMISLCLSFSGTNYLWIVTQSVIQSRSDAPTQFPVGMLGESAHSSFSLSLYFHVIL